MNPFDYMAHRLGPSVLAGSIVGCIMIGRLDTVHWLLIATGLVLSALGWWRIGRHAHS